MLDEIYTVNSAFRANVAPCLLKYEGKADIYFRPVAKDQWTNDISFAIKPMLAIKDGQQWLNAFCLKCC